jgi:hypothetical protein
MERTNHWTPGMKMAMAFIILAVLYFTAQLFVAVINGNYSDPNAPLKHDIQVTQTQANR